MATNAPQQSSPSEPTTDLRRELRQHLLELNFHAFAHCIALVIEKMGGEEVRLAGRRNWRGRNSHGGYDLEATLTSPFGRHMGKRRVIVQVKQYDTLPLYQRSIDELRGTCLRVGASEALLITTGTFAPSVDRSLLRSLLRLQESLVAPVRLIDGDSLLNLMLHHHVGVKPVETNKPVRAIPPADDHVVIDDVEDVVDTELFDNLMRSHCGNSRLECGNSPRFLVRVQVQPLRKRTGAASGRSSTTQRNYLARAQEVQMSCLAPAGSRSDRQRKPPLHRGTKGGPSSA